MLSTQNIYISDKELLEIENRLAHNLPPRLESISDDVKEILKAYNNDDETKKITMDFVNVQLDNLLECRKKVLRERADCRAKVMMNKKSDTAKPNPDHNSIDFKYNNNSTK